MSNDQIILINQALNQYDASLTDEKFIQRKGKVLPVKVEINKNRIRFVAPSGTVLGSGGVTIDAIENFVESFWWWEK